MNANGGPLGTAAAVEAQVQASETLGAQEFLTRSDLRALGFPRRAVDSIFGAVPVIQLPDYSRPLIRREDLDEFLAEHTYGENRVRP